MNIPESYKDLGWANGWSKTPKELKECRAKGHTGHEISLHQSGSHHIVVCDDCKIVHHYDSSS